jgi:iron complex outermembrane receptor protein
MDYTNLQQLLFFFDNSKAQILNLITSVKSASIKGVELEANAEVTDRLNVTVTGTMLDATYGRLSTQDSLFPELGQPLPQAPTGGNFRDLSGNRVVRAPKWQTNVSAEYSVPLWGDFTSALRASYAWQSRVFYDIFNRPSVSQGAYAVLNVSASIGTTDGRWELTAFANNATDQAYYSHKQAVIGLTSVPYVIGIAGDPRRYGVTFAHRF